MQPSPPNPEPADDDIDAEELLSAASSYNADEAKEHITDLRTQIEAHDAWIREQYNSTQTRVNALSQTVKQSERLKQMLTSQIGDNAPTQQQYELIMALKSDFIKAVARIQDDIIKSSTGQSLQSSKIKIQQLMQQNQQYLYKIQQQNISIEQHEQQIHKLRQENERLQRLKDLLMQQQDAMNQRLSQQKGKDQKISELSSELVTVKETMNVLQTEKETLSNNYKLQIESLNASCKELIEQNKSLKEQQQQQQQQHEEQQQQQSAATVDKAVFDELQSKYDAATGKADEFELKLAALKVKCDEFESKYTEQMQQNAALQESISALNERAKLHTEQLNAASSSQSSQSDELQRLQSKVVELEQDNEALTNQINVLEQENNEQIETLQSEKQKLQNQFTILLQEKTDLKRQNEAHMNKYNALSEKHEKLTNLNTDATERNLSAAAQIDELKQTVSDLQSRLENVNKTESNNSSVLQSKIDELTKQISVKNQQISEQRTKGEEMHNQRETLQKRLQESQKSLLSAQTKCQELETKIEELTQRPIEQQPQLNSTRSDTPDEPPQPSNVEDAISNQDVLAFTKMNNRLAPIGNMITAFISDWKYNAQIFVLDKNNEIKENESMQAHSNRAAQYKQWKQLEAVLESVSSQISSMKQNGEYCNQSQQQFHALMLELLNEKILLLKHLGSVHMAKSQQMSQVMHEAQKRIISLQSDLVKKNREMEMNLKVKEKMYEEIKNVQQEVQNLTKEYQVVVRELENARGGGHRAESVDSSFS